MRLKLEQLERHLAQPRLAPIYLVTGDEPLQRLEACDAIRARARELGYGERTVLELARDFDWNRLRQAGANLSLFAERRLVELHMGEHSPGRDGGPALIEYSTAAPADNLLLISAGRFDGKSRQTKWFKALDGAGAVIDVWPIEPAQLPNWIIARMRRMGRGIDPAAAAIIAERVEGNLLAARQELEKLVLLVEHGDVGVQEVERAVADSARFDTFVLVDACLLGERERVVRTLRGLRAEGFELPMVIGGLMWELRQVCSMACAMAGGLGREQAMAAGRVWEQRRARVAAALHRHPAAAMSAFLQDAAALDRASKGALKADAWRMLEEFLLRVAGSPLGLQPAR